MQRTFFRLLGVLFLGFVFSVSNCFVEGVNAAGEQLTQPAVNESVSHLCFKEVKSPRLNPDGYLKKVDNFVVIFDPSASMSEEYNGRNKFDFAKCLVRRMNSRIPLFKMQGALRTFGYPVYTSLLYGFSDYDPEDFDIALSTLKSANGVSPLEFAIRASSNDFDKLSGKIAMIIFTDGKNMDDDVVTETRKLVKKFGDRVCIYVVFIGNDPRGKELLQRVESVSKCGSFMLADEINSSEAMDQFVKSIFLCKDSDKDGVCDDMDECPDTPIGAKVDSRGCWDPGVVLFDFDKYYIKHKYYPILNEVLKVMKLNPDLKIRIEGHTDIIGTEGYNKKLSIRRAGSGKNYLVNKGIRPERISIIGYGFSRPRAPSDTAAHRALNRRIEFKIMR